MLNKAPKINEPNIAIMFWGNELNKPINKASFTSPKPIPFPFVKKYKDQKNSVSRRAEIKWALKSEKGTVKKVTIRTRIIEGITAKSGIS